MHEYSLASAIIEQCKQIAEQNGALRVKKVTVRASPYEMIIPDLLKDAYEIITSELPLFAGSTLELIIDDPEIICLNCEYQGPPDEKGDPEYAYNFKCPRCGSRDTHVNFKELIIESLDVELPEKQVA